MITDEKYMRRCLKLASMGAGNVAPNPMVGAVLVHQEKVIGEGYHRIYGGAHAEVNCIQSVSEENRHLIAESTLYVSLEPCNHYGKTPPCTEMIIKNGIRRVVTGCRDQNEKVNGSGVARLRDSGIEVAEGVCEKESEFLNRRFFTFHRKKRPYVILKWAESSDGFIGGSGGRIKISNRITDRMVHKWRSEEAAVMVGTKTALTDDPVLSTRLWPGPDPVRVVLDLNEKLPGNLNLFNKKVRTIAITTTRHENDGDLAFRKVSGLKANVIVETLDILFKENIQSLIVEGGSGLLNSFIDSGIWDEARVIINRKLSILSGVRSPYLPVKQPADEDEYGSDRILYFLNH